jgi:hypothetical protein
MESGWASAFRQVDNGIELSGKDRTRRGCPLVHAPACRNIVTTPSARLNIGIRRSSEPERPSSLLRSLRTLTEEASRGGQASPRLRPVRPTGR